MVIKRTGCRLQTVISIVSSAVCSYADLFHHPLKCVSAKGCIVIRYISGLCNLLLGPLSHPLTLQIQSLKIPLLCCNRATQIAKNTIHCASLTLHIVSGMVFGAKVLQAQEHPSIFCICVNSITDLHPATSNRFCLYCEHYRTSSGKNHRKRWLLVGVLLPYDVR